MHHDLPHRGHGRSDVDRRAGRGSSGVRTALTHSCASVRQANTATRECSPGDCSAATSGDPLADAHPADGHGGRASTRPASIRRRPRSMRCARRAAAMIILPGPLTGWSASCTYPLSRSFWQERRTRAASSLQEILAMIRFTDHTTTMMTTTVVRGVVAPFMGFDMCPR